MKVKSNFLNMEKLGKKWVFALFVFVFCIFLIGEILTPLMNGKDQRERNSPDTFIPKGYLLLPIEIENKEFMSSLSNGLAQVDLYVNSEKSKKKILLMSSVKIIQAPLNPKQFGVLVEEKYVESLMRMEGPFTVVLHNPEEHGPEGLRARDPNIEALPEGETHTEYKGEKNIQQERNTPGKVEYQGEIQ